MHAARKDKIPMYNPKVALKTKYNTKHTISILKVLLLWNTNSLPSNTKTPITSVSSDIPVKPTVSSHSSAQRAFSVTYTCQRTML
jgi:hypothetical protein